MKAQNENAPLIKDADNKLNKVYGAIGNQTPSIQPDHSNNKCTLDAGGIAATSSAYVGGISSVTVISASKAISVSLSSAACLAISIGVGLATATCTFFACRKIITELNHRCAHDPQNNASNQNKPLTPSMKLEM